MMEHGRNARRAFRTFSIAIELNKNFVNRASCAGAAAVLMFGGAHMTANAQLLPYQVVGDAITERLGATPGDAARGRAIVANRQLGLCLLCHSGPIPEERFQGNLAPDLAGAGGRWSEGQLRLRIVDASRLNPATIMPSYYRADGLTRVNNALRSQTILTAQQIEDVVAYLRTLRNDTPTKADRIP
jgi:sulfur-oxidizing protein SoxX